MEATTVIIHFSVSDQHVCVDARYAKPGVWALWARDEDHTYICLEVGQTKQIQSELHEDLEILLCHDRDDCGVLCEQSYLARRRFEWSTHFLVHTCKYCTKGGELRRKYARSNPRCVDKYRHIRKEFKELEFRFLEGSGLPDRRERLKIEETYARKHKARYWFS